MTSGTLRAMHSGIVVRAIACFGLLVCAAGCSELRELPDGGGSEIHGAGVLDPASPDFHGTFLRDLAYDFEYCEQCHGDDLMGGVVGVSCYDCHSNGPTSCDTCHREDLLEVGSHSAHVGFVVTDLDFADCVKCHDTPASYDDVDHILLADGTLDLPPAEVNFGTLAATDPVSPNADRTGPPTYDIATGTCSQVYCHGDVFADANASLTEPVWGQDGQAFCGSCHGVAPGSHAATACHTCHQRVVDETGFIAPELHVDGMTQIGRHGTACTSCHGMQGIEMAPPLSLTGGTSPSLPGVGAHQSHRTQPSGLMTRVLECSDCHKMPASLHDVGHIDSERPAEVFPGGAAFPGLAAAGGAAPVYDPVAGTCSGVYCHGQGTTLSNDTNAANQTPDWTSVGQGEAACGTCHGYPPAVNAFGTHPSATSCTGCHSGTVSGSPGSFVFTDRHINGGAN